MCWLFQRVDVRSFWIRQVLWKAIQDPLCTLLCRGSSGSISLSPLSSHPWNGLTHQPGLLSVSALATVSGVYFIHQKLLHPWGHQLVEVQAAPMSPHLLTVLQYSSLIRQAQEQIDPFNCKQENIKLNDVICICYSYLKHFSFLLSSGHLPSVYFLFVPFCPLLPFISPSKYFFRDQPHIFYYFTFLFYYHLNQIGFGRQNNAPLPECSHPQPRNCDYIILHRRKDLEDAINVSDLREGEHPEFSSWAQSKHMSS